MRSIARAPLKASGLAAALRIEERRAVDRALSGKATLLTGSSRARDSAIFLAAAELAGRPVLVASPAAAELYEQARQATGVDVVALGSFLPESERARAKKRLARGGALLVIVEPAQLLADELRRAAAKAPWALLGIAAAHACSEHAHELEPAYLSLREAQRGLGATPLATCTLTTERVVGQVLESLGAGPGAIVAAGEPLLERTALVVRSAERRAALLSAVRAWGAPGIVLAATAQEADAVFAELSTQGVACVRSHAGMGASEREAALSRFRSPHERLVLVTQSPHANASGLTSGAEQGSGLSSAPPRADLRFIAHYQAPLCSEQLFEDLAWLPAGGSSLVLSDSSDAALVQALLAQQRLKPTAIEAVARALNQAPADKPSYMETLALRAGMSRRSAERVLSAFEGRNLTARDNGQILRRVSPETLTSEARLLAARFAALRAADGARAEAVAHYVASHQGKVPVSPAVVATATAS